MTSEPEPIYQFRTSSICDLAAYRDRIGHDVWRAMEIKVYTALSELLPEHYYDISLQVPEQDQELFVKVCCLFLLEQPSDSHRHNKIAYTISLRTYTHRQ